MGQGIVKRVLMIAYHFPPLNVSSGIERTLRFAQYLPEFGWEPAILSVHPRAYWSVASDGGRNARVGMPVRRAFALDSARHLSIAGRYPRLLGLPDRWWTWWLGAVPAGMALIRQFRPDVIWSTYPIATAHMIGATLQRLSGLPWVSDFRDPMAQEGYPTDPLTHRLFRRIEYRALSRSARAIFTAPGARRLYAERYPEIPSERLAVIENGYDETAFADAHSEPGGRPERARSLVLLHSGTIYESERDPRALLAALGDLRRSNRIRPGELKIVLRATGCDDYLARLAREAAVEELIELAPAIGYRSALAEMLSADALLVLQAKNCNDQIPAKIYEYLRARRPILALTDPAGDTAAVLRRSGIDTIAPLDSRSAIAEALPAFIERLGRGDAPVASESSVQAASRRARTAELAGVLDRTTSSSGVGGDRR